MNILAKGVSWEGPGTDPEKSKMDSHAFDFQGGLRTKARGHKGPTRALPGRPKGPTHIGKIGFGGNRLQKVCFSQFLFDNLWEKDSIFSQKVL